MVNGRRIDCVGGIVSDTDGRLLMVRRGNEPAKGCWSVPGGRREPGESDAAATAREVLEETGLHVRVGHLVGTVERDAADGSVYVVRDYLCTPLDHVDPAAVRAADDATDAGWYTPEEVHALDCVPGLLQALHEWGVLPVQD